MTKGVIKKYESTRCKIGSYYIREHICAFIHDAIVDSNGMKTNAYLDNPVDILNTPAAQSVNVLYVESMFPTFSDDIKKQMDITEFINTISSQNIIPACKYAGEIGNIELTFIQTCSITGTLSISYNWRKFSDFETYANDTELHTITGVIKYNKRYYTITPQVIELLQEGVLNTTVSGEHVTLAKMLNYSIPNTLSAEKIVFFIEAMKLINQSKMRVAVIGSRCFTNYNLLSDTLTKFDSEPNQKITAIISGGAQGADKLAEVFAKVNTIPIIIHLPDWAKHGRAAGPIRNKQIISDADHVIAFWDGKSTGTLSSINIAKKLGKPLSIVSI